MLYNTTSELQDSTVQQASTGFLSSTSKVAPEIIPQTKQTPASFSQEKHEGVIRDLKTLRREAKEKLNTQLNQPITNAQDNTQAIINTTSIKEMLSAKALMQSTRNGFTPAKHIKAVENIASLFQKATFLESQAPRHYKQHVKGYRVYESDFEDAKAILSVQARKVNNDVIYFLKLETLEPSNLKPTALGKSPDLALAVESQAYADTLPSAKAYADSTIKRSFLRQTQILPQNKATFINKAVRKSIIKLKPPIRLTLSVLTMIQLNLVSNLNIRKLQI